MALGFRVLFVLGVCAAFGLGQTPLSLPAFRPAGTLQITAPAGEAKFADFDRDGYADLFVPNIFFPVPQTTGFAYIYRGLPKGHFEPAQKTYPLFTLQLPARLEPCYPHIYIADNRGNVWRSSHTKNLQFSKPTLVIPGLPTVSVFDVSTCDSIVALDHGERLFVSQSYAGQNGLDSSATVRTVPALYVLHKVHLGTVYEVCAGRYDKTLGDDLIGLRGLPQQLPVPAKTYLFAWSPHGHCLFSEPLWLTETYALCVRQSSVFVSGIVKKQALVVEYSVDWDKRRFEQQATYGFSSIVQDLGVANGRVLCFGQDELTLLSGEKILSYPHRSAHSSHLKYATVRDFTHDGNDDFFRFSGTSTTTGSVYTSTASFCWGWESMPGTGSWGLTCFGKARRGNKEFSIVAPSSCVLGWNFFAAPKPYWFGLHVPPRSVWVGQRFHFPIPLTYQNTPIFFQARKKTGQVSQVLKVVLDSRR